MKRKIMRGDIYYANLEPVVGSEQGGERPVIIIQNNLGNWNSPTLIVAAITTIQKKPNLPTHVKIGTLYTPEESVILLEQLRTIDKKRLLKFVDTVNGVLIKKVDKALKISVGLTPLIKPDVLCLCPQCLKQFEKVPGTIIRRVNKNSTKDICTYCNSNKGYDYEIWR